MKQFIIGIGSQRAGSTFLWKLLGSHPQVRMNPVKELHYFDTLFGIRDAKVLRAFSKKTLTREINGLCGAKEFGFINPHWQWHLKTQYQLSSTPIEKINYLDLFSHVIEAEDVSFVGESTPEYMLLEEAHIRKLKDTVGDAHIILMCRNPIKRTISSFRLLLSGRKEAVLPEQRDQLFMSLLTGDRPWVRVQEGFNNYKLAAANYRKFFDKVLLLPFDDIVESPSRMLGSLSQFLGISFDERVLSSSFQTKINVVEGDYVPGLEVMSRLESVFEHQLKEAEDLLGSRLKY